MSNDIDKYDLECQQCGEIVRRLSASELNKVVNNPHNFTIFCDSCHLDEKTRILMESANLDYATARAAAQKIDF